MGVETLGDLESKVVSVVVVIMAVTFLEHFIRWENAAQTLQYGAALALVVGALVAFQFYNHRAKEDQRSHGNEQVRAQREMAMSDREQHDVIEPKEALTLPINPRQVRATNEHGYRRLPARVLRVVRQRF